MALGDSITMGDWLPARETYPGQLQTFLRASRHPALEDREVWVINAGVGAIDLENEFAILMETGFLAKPDVVLVGADSRFSPSARAATGPSRVPAGE